MIWRERERERETDRQTDRDRETHTDRQTDRDRETLTYVKAHTHTFVHLSLLCFHLFVFPFSKTDLLDACILFHRTDKNLNNTR